MSGFEIREGRPGDASALVELARAVSAEPGDWLLATDGWRSASAERRYLRAVRRSPHAAVFVAEVPEGLVGRLSVSRDPHQRLWPGKESPASTD